MRQTDTMSKISTSKNIDITNKMKDIENLLKERLANNWVSVRKAFLDLDVNYDGHITAEEFAKLVGGASGINKFDFNLLKMLMKLRNGGSAEDGVTYT